MSQNNPKVWPLLAAVLLPIVLVLAVWLTHHGDKELSPPPQYSFLYATKEPDYRSRYLKEHDGQVHLFFINRKNEAFDQQKMPTLYLYNVQTRQAQAVPYVPTEELTPTDTWQSVPVDIPTIRHIHYGPKAPDGYAYERRYHGSTWLNPFRSGYKNAHVIYKDKNTLVFSSEKRAVNFIGWQTEVTDANEN